MVEDAIKNINTQMVSGKAPDIIILDGCSIESYVEKGTLLPLRDLVDTDDIFTSVICPFQTKGNFYSLLTHFYLPPLIAKPEE